MYFSLTSKDRDRGDSQTDPASPLFDKKNKAEDYNEAQAQQIMYHNLVYERGENRRVLASVEASLTNPDVPDEGQSSENDNRRSM